tara:strand:- start:15902 stop:16306 length:405 start_codon:yes stop_codon:yes gene_type:complete
LLKYIGENPLRGGLFVGLAIGAPHFLLPVEWSIAIAALTLVFIAGIYVGFAIMNGREKAFATETSVAVTFSLLGLGGLLFSAWFIPIGLVGHAIWDMIHHRKSHLLAEVPTWYIPFCIVIDVVLAVVLAISWIV